MFAVVVGHNSRSQGAVRKDTGETEFSWNSRLADMIDALSHRPEYAGLFVRVFHRDPRIGSYRREIEDVYRRTDKWGADVTVELHFNSHHNPKATGTETLSSGSRMSTKYAYALQEEMLDALDLKDRGKKIVRTGRGSASLISGKAPAALIEPFFGSSDKGLAATDEPEEMKALAHAVLKATHDVFCK